MAQKKVNLMIMLRAKIKRMLSKIVLQIVMQRAKMKKVNKVHPMKMLRARIKKIQSKIVLQIILLIVRIKRM